MSLTLTGAGSVSPGEVDPLEGITFALRLQTHRGDGVPLGLYSDEAGTIPAVEWDTVACWSDELSLSGLSAIQPNPDKRPLLRLLAGSPVLEFDGIDDSLQVVGFTMATIATIAARLTLKTVAFNKPWTHLGNQVGEVYANGSGSLVMANGSNGPSWPIDTTTPHSHQCYHNGAASSWILDGTEISTGNVGSGTPSGDLSLSLPSTAYTEMQISAFMASPGFVGESALLQSYLSSLQ